MKNKGKLLFLRTKMQEKNLCNNKELKRVEIFVTITDRAWTLYEIE